MEEKNSSKKIIVMVVCAAVLAIALLAVCVLILTNQGKGEAEKPADTMETAVEETAEVQQPEEAEPVVAEEAAETTVEEEQAEDATENLSDEEWFHSLNLDGAWFMIFNEITGERKLLENGEHYTLLEGDELASWYPLDWKFVGLNPMELYGDLENRFDCIFIDLSNKQISEDTKLTLYVKDTDGNEVQATVYLSK